MKPEELALILNDLGYKPLMDTIKAIDPDLYQVIEAITIVRQHSFGKIELEVADGKIVLVSKTLKTRLR
jgi:hypothetical protein